MKNLVVQITESPGLFCYHPLGSFTTNTSFQEVTKTKVYLSFLGKVEVFINRKIKNTPSTLASLCLHLLKTLKEYVKNKYISCL
jgi:hypothetical protein